MIDGSSCANDFYRDEVKWLMSLLRTCFKDFSGCLMMSKMPVMHILDAILFLLMRCKTYIPSIISITIIAPWPVASKGNPILDQAPHLPPPI